jgi:hypothetical protein
MPELTGPVLASGIIATSFAYSFATRKKPAHDTFVSNISNNIDRDNANSNVDR